MLRKIFGGLKMSWPVVIIFAVLAGAYTALMALLVPDSCSFHDIAVTFEAWVLMAIIIIVNCEKPLEAAAKTFVFFLISQPLVYLIQVPFSSMGWGLFGYYRYWFILTLLTFPGAFIGWFIKKDNIWSGLILSVMLVLLALLGVGYARTAIDSFPHHLLSAVYCFVCIPVLIFGVLKNKKARTAAGIISILACAVCIISYISKSGILISPIELDREAYPIDGTWSVSVEDESISTAEITQDASGEYHLVMDFDKTGPNVVILEDGQGEQYRLQIGCSSDNSIDVIALD